MTHKFKVGDVIVSLINGKRYSVVVAIDGLRAVDAHWIVDVKDSNVVSIDGLRAVAAHWIVGVKDSYVVLRESDGSHYVIPFRHESYWHRCDAPQATAPVASISVGDVVKVSRGYSYGWDGPYEIVESVFTRRFVSYWWAGASAHARELDDCWIARDDNGEYVVIKFSEQGKLSVVSKEKHCGFCSRCGEKLVEKISRGFLDGPTFTVKKCASCGYCT